MPGLTIASQQALRIAVMQSSLTDLSKVSDMASKIQETALEKARIPQTSGSPASPGNAVQPSSLESEAIGVAVAGLKLGYMLLSEGYASAKRDRLGFDKERKAEIATFVVPTDKVAKELSKEQKTIVSFIEMAQTQPSLLSYLGIKETELKTDAKSKFYSVLPYYSMGHGEASQSTNQLNIMRNRIDLFLNTHCKKAIQSIDNSFNQRNQYVAALVRLEEGSNFLNDLRVPRFVIMSMSNLLWNLEHPVSEEGFPLTTDDAIQLCNRAEAFLNKLQNQDQSPFLHKLDHKELLTFIDDCRAKVSQLRKSYEVEKATDINVGDIANSAHSALRAMDISMFELVYKRKDVNLNTLVPDETAAQTLASILTDIDGSLVNTDFFSVINTFVQAKNNNYALVPKEAGMNSKLSTTADVLILLCHLTKTDRDNLIAKIRRDLPKNEETKAFCARLNEFHKTFVEPIQAKVSLEKGDTLKTGNQPHQSVSIRTARRLVPFVPLVIGDFARMNAESGKPEQSAELATDMDGSKKIKLDLDKQLQAIGTSAKSGKGYYTWDILTLGRPITDPTVLDMLKELPKYQYRMTQITALLDTIRELTETYRNCLTDPSFVKFMKDCFQKINEETMGLRETISQIDKSLFTSGQSEDRSLLDVLHPMSIEFGKQMNSVVAAIGQLDHVVSAPDFTEKERARLEKKYDAIKEQYFALFGELPNLQTSKEKMTGVGMSAPRAVPLQVAQEATTQGPGIKASEMKRELQKLKDPDDKQTKPTNFNI